MIEEGFSVVGSSYTQRTGLVGEFGRKRDGDVRGFLRDVDRRLRWEVRGRVLGVTRLDRLVRLEVKVRELK